MSKKSGWSRLLASLVLVLPNIIRVCADLSTLIGVEVRKTTKHIFSLLILGFFIAILMASTWITALFMLFIYLTENLHYTNMLSALILFLLNIILLLFTALIASNIKKQLLFKETCAQCKKICGLH